jgi:hypothetical protein
MYRTDPGDRRDWKVESRRVVRLKKEPTRPLYLSAGG